MQLYYFSCRRLLFLHVLASSTHPQAFCFEVVLFGIVFVRCGIGSVLPRHISPLKMVSKDRRKKEHAHNSLFRICKPARSHRPKCLNPK